VTLSGEVKRDAPGWDGASPYPELRPLPASTPSTGAYTLALIIGFTPLRALPKELTKLTMSWPFASA
jgi:hypothetical protein